MTQRAVRHTKTGQEVSAAVEVMKQRALCVVFSLPYQHKPTNSTSENMCPQYKRYSYKNEYRQKEKIIFNILSSMDM
jgi:hypothetical protein